MKTGFSEVLQENLLFWNMWNIAYAYDILEKDHEGYEAHFDMLREMWDYCWAAVEAKHIDKKEFLVVFGKTYPAQFDEDGMFIRSGNILHDTYDEMRESVLSEFCITLLVGAFSHIYDGVIAGRRYGVRAGELPIEVIHGIVSSNGLGYMFSDENVSLPIVQDELAAQRKVLQELSQPSSYTIQDRHIYRNAVAMQSMQFIEQE